MPEKIYKNTVIDTAADPVLAAKFNKKPIVDASRDIGAAETKYSNLILREIDEKYKTISMPKYNWRRDKPDSRDYAYTGVMNSQTVVDLRSYMTAVEDQGRLGSCTGQAVAGAIEYLNKRSGAVTDVSRLFIYYYERLIEGTVHYDSGAYIRDGIKAVNHYGAPLEKLWPYSIPKFRDQPSTAAVNDAARRKVTLYERVANFDGCITALSNNYPVIVGFDVYSSFQSAAVTRTGLMPYPNVRRERLLGGHAVLLVGYNKNTKRFIARNSWGVNWGDRGYFYMPFQVIQNTTMSDDFWVVKSVLNP
jgi:C1A family cysteine protease